MFAGAAFRLGHTMISDDLLMLDNDCAPVNGGSVSLVEAFFNPEIIQSHGIEPLLKGFSVQHQQEINLGIVDNLRNFLFGNSGTGLDLASLNIQRGRDHGLRNYNEVRQAMLGSSVSSFSEINSDPAIYSALQNTYSDINDCLLYTSPSPRDQRGSRMPSSA